ncbi:MAG: hypothetical protein HN595_02280 [Flavobacteriaceae bacterium]|jgi:hypothetical protein|nr:hypothetical protein [Flavobacteriaceae bacterium]
MKNTKRERFIKLAEKRMSKAINQLRLIKNLSNKNNYEYTESDWRAIHKDLSYEINMIKLAFSDTKEKKKWTLKR